MIQTVLAINGCDWMIGDGFRAGVGYLSDRGAENRGQ